MFLPIILKTVQVKSERSFSKKFLSFTIHRIIDWNLRYGKYFHGKSVFSGYFRKVKWYFLIYVTVLLQKTRNMLEEFQKILNLSLAFYYKECDYYIIFSIIVMYLFVKLFTSMVIIYLSICLEGVIYLLRIFCAIFLLIFPYCCLYILTLLFSSTEKGILHHWCSFHIISHLLPLLFILNYLRIWNTNGIIANN